jgi:hypothetical protein
MVLKSETVIVVGKALAHLNGTGEVGVGISNSLYCRLLGEREVKGQNNQSKS